MSKPIRTVLAEQLVDRAELERLRAAVPVVLAACDKIECCLEGVTATTAREIDAALATIRRALAGVGE